MVQAMARLCLLVRATYPSVLTYVVNASCFYMSLI